MALYLLLQIFWLATTLEGLASQPQVTTKPGCPDKCGNVEIPYPFGIGDSCNIGVGGFNITCNDSAYDPPKPFKGGLEVLDISLVSGLMRISGYVCWQCFNETGGVVSTSRRRLNLNSSSSFTFSETHNKFVAIGCDTHAYIIGSLGRNFTSGCMSFCSDTYSMIDGDCSGIGCCQTSIPKAFKRYEVDFDSNTQHQNVLSFNPCSFAFLVDQNAFSFKASDLNRLNRSQTMPVVLDWGIGNESCEIARKDATTFACVSEHSTCYDSTNGEGYRCNCSKGYQGNPYLSGGCQDINECEENHEKKLCEHNCINLPGSYYCSCQKGYKVLQDDERYCTKNKSVVFAVLMGVGIGVSLLLLLIGGFWSYWARRKRRLIKQKEKFFQQNGGFLLEEKRQSFAETFKIFTREELQMATNNYDKSQIVGQGGFGTVYKGILRNNKMVAVKKSKIVDKTQIEQFINEVHILSQISHRNIVKLLGCCLEEEVPILVYEFISNGTLSEHIHGDGFASSLSLENRLRIATETAGALYYLHSIASAPIFHRDVKSANVLLDNNFTAKVSDFGASRLVRLDQTQVTTLVMGTWGYLDPEYHQTGQLTAKSDVYGFGMILLELLTGERPISSTRSEEYKSLSRYFLSSMKENRLFEILEDRVRDEGGEEELMAVAQLAKRCLKHKGEERPTMKEVVVELERLRSHEHPWEPNNHEEIEILLGETSQGHASNSTYSTCEYSVDSHTLSALEIGH
ncbi:wall-associated receptor kinase 2-like isoform X3 [Magnolia sinica]|uniref:wall-associated receptor kinase 2-like isoform X3 n=1 Tax=Magnolia sinica TaxID=86752 RepID=UPI0026591C80|nr:wall-associated receptor kinase 2-like isoform X3 [Magnolia sinica]